MHDLARRRLTGEAPDTLILLEHDPVFTAGRRSEPDDVRWSPEAMRRAGAELHHIDRGGSLTFHGPGQLVAYPILDLGSRPDVVAHLRRLEEVVIRAADDVGVALHRSDVQTGAWAGDRKVCAIGVKLQRWRVTLHGLALNCSTDMRWYEAIVPCGLPGHGVASLSELAARDVTVGEMAPLVGRHFEDVFGLKLEPGPEEETAAFGSAEHFEEVVSAAHGA